MSRPVEIVASLLALALTACGGGDPICRTQTSTGIFTNLVAAAFITAEPPVRIEASATLRGEGTAIVGIAFAGELAEEQTVQVQQEVRVSVSRMVLSGPADRPGYAYFSGRGAGITFSGVETRVCPL